MSKIGRGMQLVCRCTIAIVYDKIEKEWNIWKLLFQGLATNGDIDTFDWREIVYCV